ncbi:MAG: 4-phosphopantetheinyl transferase [Verrucomicrobiales bacterium]|nr:4-phosphopantetheinyl transferase [Verrucomicrobiales bacterium]
MNQPAPGKAIVRRPLLPHTSLRLGHFLRSSESFQASFCWSSASLETLIAHQSQFLRPPELEYLQRALHANRRRSYLLGRYCAKEAICQYLRDERLDAFAVLPGVFQQPIVRGPRCHNIQVSLTHCANWGMAAAFDEAHPIAIDIEAVSPDRRETIQSQLTENEKLAAAHLPGNLDENLVSIWTAKEALSKVLKTGMMTPFTLFEVEKISETERGLSGLFKSFAQYRFLSFTAGSIAVSLVFPKLSELDESLGQLRDEICQSLIGVAVA